MDLTTILQVAISLIFVWLILSIAVMYLQDWLGTQLRWRSQMLETFIGNMLTDPALADQFYSHPLIKSLHSGEEGNRRPSKISSQMFTMTLFDLVINAGKKPSILHQEVYKLRSTIDQLQKNDKARADAQFELVLLAARKALNTQAGKKRSIMPWRASSWSWTTWRRSTPCSRLLSSKHSAMSKSPHRISTVSCKLSVMPVNSRPATALPILLQRQWINCAMDWLSWQSPIRS